jgi:hypothetical protein
VGLGSKSEIVGDKCHVAVRDFHQQCLRGSCSKEVTLVEGEVKVKVPPRFRIAPHT